MDENKTIQLILKFALREEAAAKKAATDLGDIAKRFEKLQTEADQTRKKIKDALSQDKPADDLKKKLGEINAELSKTSAKALELQRRMDSAKWESVQKLGAGLQNVGDKIGQIGSMATMAGAAIAGPFLAAAQNYVNKSPMDEVAIRWLDAQGEIEASFLRIGRVSADQLLPFLERAADLAEDMAGFVERNPELIKALVGLGGGLFATGAVLQGGSAIAKTVGAGADLLGKAGGFLAGGGGAAGAGAAIVPAAVGAAALGAGGYIGYQAGNAVNRAIGQDEQSGSDLWRTARQLSAVVNPLGLISQGLNAAGFEEQAGKLWDFNRALLGLGDAADDAKEKTATSSIVTESMLNAFDAWEEASRAIENSEKAAGEARTAIVEQAGAQRVELEQRYEEARAKAMESYTTARADAEADYYRSRGDVARRYNVDIQRAEQDHQRKMRQMQISHNQRVRELVNDRDALGLIGEIGSYEQQRSDEEENYRIEMRRKSEDFAAQIAQMDANFRVQQDRRARDFERQMQEADARQAQELEKINLQAEQKLSLLDDQHKKELESLRKNEQNRHAMLRSVALNDNSLLHRETAEMTARYKNWLETAARNLSLPGGGGYNAPPGRANGGYAWDGIYRLGEKGTEYVMDNDLTKSAERALGGPVTKYGLSDALLGRGRGASAGSGAGALSMRIETQSLTLGQVIREIDSRLTQNNRALTRAFGG
jgi:hypothetical protein